MYLIHRIFQAKGTSIDALLLTVVRLVTMVMGLACVKITSIYFSLEEYGLYSQAILVISTTCSFTILGMTDAVNFFYNKNDDKKAHTKDQYLGTIFCLQTIVGVFAAFLIIIGSQFLVDYFNNPALISAIGWIAFQPVLQNYIAMLQVLYISVGRAKSIVVINLVLSVIKLAIFSIATFVTGSIITILMLTLLCDVCQVLYFLLDLRRHKIKIHLKKFCIKLCRPIISYAVPMAAFVIINSLMRDTDKWIVGYLANSEDLAIYTNCSRLLPFDILTASFFTVLVPIVTRYISTNKDKVCKIYGDYLNIGLISTSILVGIAIWLRRDLLLSLYDEKYLPGLSVFVVYLLVDFIRFANVTLLYSASGQAKKLLNIVLFSFVLNLVMAVLLFYAIGLLGPALATLITTIFSYYIYIRGGSKIIQFPIFKLFNFRRFFAVLIQVCIIGAISLYLSNLMMGIIGAIERFLILFSVAVFMVGSLNYKYIFKLIREINSIR